MLLYEHDPDLAVAPLSAVTEHSATTATTKALREISGCISVIASNMGADAPVVSDGCEDIVNDRWPA